MFNQIIPSLNCKLAFLLNTMRYVASWSILAILYIRILWIIMYLICIRYVSDTTLAFWHNKLWSCCTILLIFTESQELGTLSKYFNSCLFVCPLWKSCVILLSIKLRRMAWWNDGMVEWWNDGMMEWWNVWM